MTAGRRHRNEPGGGKRGITNGRMSMNEGADGSARPFRESFDGTMASSLQGAAAMVGQRYDAAE